MTSDELIEFTEISGRRLMAVTKILPAAPQHTSFGSASCLFMNLYTLKHNALMNTGAQSPGLRAATAREGALTLHAAA